MAEQGVYRTEICVQCGQRLQIPADLEEFSCVYCGFRQHKQLAAVQVDQDRARNLLELAQQGSLQCATFYPEPLKYLNRKMFAQAFEDYEMQCKQTFLYLDAAVKYQPAMQTEMLDAFIQNFFSQLAQWLAAHHGKKSYFSRAKTEIAIYMLPMVDHLQLSISDAFCARFVSSWVQQYPKDQIAAGTYEQVMGGFRSDGLCYITTAVCQSLQKADDCPELTAFRAFRDGYLTQCSDGPALIAAYYETAPAIVTMITCLGHGERVYPSLWQTYLQPCYQLLQLGRCQACKQLYTAMVRQLQKTYLS